MAHISNYIVGQPRLQMLVINMLTHQTATACLTRGAGASDDDRAPSRRDRAALATVHLIQAMCAHGFAA